MYEFTNTKEVIPTLKAEIELNGDVFSVNRINSVDTNKLCKELLGFQFRILDWSDREETLRINGLNKLFLDHDFRDRITYPGVNPGVAVKFDTSGVLKPYLDPEGLLSYTYSERMSYQYGRIITILQDKPYTRQAFISVWDAYDDINKLETERVPCSIGYQFILRDSKLNMIYTMRSLEVSICLGNDMYTASKLLEYIASKVGVDTGFIQFNIGSMHIFNSIK